MNIKGKEKLELTDYALLSIIAVILNYFWASNLGYAIIKNTPLLAYINYFNDQGLYKDSLVIAGFKNYFTYYFQLAAQLNNLLGIDYAVTLLSVIPGLIMVVAVFMMGYVVTDNKYVGYLTILLTLSHWQMGAALGSEAFGNQLANVSFATPFLLLSLVLLLKQYFKLAFLIIGLLFNIHAPLAVATLFIVLYCLITNKAISVRQVMYCFAIFSLASIPTIIWYAQNIHISHPVYDQTMNSQMLKLNRLRSVHSFPFNWAWSSYGFFAAFAINLVLLKKLKPTIKEDIYKNIKSIIYGVFILCFAGLVFVEIYNMPLITQLSLFRATRFLIVISSIMISAYLLMDTSPYLKIEKGLALIIITSLMTLNIKIALIAEAFFFVLLAVNSYTNINKKFDYILLITGIFCLIIALFKAHFLFYNAKPFLGVMIIAIVFNLLSRVVSNRKTLLNYSALLFVVIMFAFMGQYNAYSELQKESMLAEKEAQLWIRANSSVEDKILIPPGLMCWENYSRRDVFLTYNDLAYAFYNINLAPRIFNLLKDYGINIETIDQPKALYEQMGKIYKSWGDTKIDYLADKYNIKYMVSDNYIQTAHQLAYENNHFKIYRLH